MRKRKLFGMALVALMTSFSACSNDAEEVLSQKDEIRLTSEITPSRVSSLNCQSTQIVSGQKVGVTITGAKDSHSNIPWSAGDNGVLTNTGDKVYWGSTDINVTAYHPYNADWAGGAYTFSVNTNQSAEADYLNSDLLWTQKTASKTESPVSLTFQHVLSKINVTLTSANAIDLSNATISICGTNASALFNTASRDLSNASNVQEIIAGTTSANAYTASAIIIPQKVAAGTKFIKVVHTGKTYYYTLTQETDFSHGYSYSYNLKVGSESLEKVSSNITDWNNVTIEGEMTEHFCSFVADVTSAGTLSTVIPADQKNTITDLKITGYLNSDDIRFIREMAGSTSDYSTARDESNTGSLVNLDISGCTVVEGGDYFYKDNNDEEYSTSANDLGWNAFVYTQLQSISLPTTITCLGYNVLAHTNITEITIPNSVTGLNGGYLFEGSTIRTINLPNTLQYTTLMGAFSCCPDLETFNIEEGNTGFFVDNGVLYAQDEHGKYLYTCPGAKTSATIANDTKEILYSAFGGCHITTITIPARVTEIHWNAFRNCDQLTEIVMESSTPPTAIQTVTDSNNNPVLDKNGKKIQQTPFDNNEGPEAFKTRCKLKVPAGSKATYLAAEGWSKYFDATNIIEY